MYYSASLAGDCCVRGVSLLLELPEDVDEPGVVVEVLRDGLLHDALDPAGGDELVDVGVELAERGRLLLVAVSHGPNHQPAYMRI